MESKVDLAAGALSEVIYEDLVKGVDYKEMARCQQQNEETMTYHTTCKRFKREDIAIGNSTFTLLLCHTHLWPGNVGLCLRPCFASIRHGA